MKRSNVIFCTAILTIILISGCATKIKPTDVCKYNIPISELYSSEDFNYIDFFDLAIEVAKENRFAPPMKYDKQIGLLVFGHEDVSTMPGLKMVTYMWVENASTETVENICINTQIIDVKGSSLTEGTSKEAILNFKDELEKEYFKKIEDTKRIFKKYQTK